MHGLGFSLQTDLQRAPPLPHCLLNSGDFIQKTDDGATETVSFSGVVWCGVVWCGVVWCGCLCWWSSYP